MSCDVGFNFSVPSVTVHVSSKYLTAISAQQSFHSMIYWLASTIARSICISFQKDSGHEGSHLIK